MSKSFQISSAEWDVMEAIWSVGECTAADVIKQLRMTHDWNHRTIRTLLGRLVEKEVLDYEADSSRYIYRAAVSREQCVRTESRAFLDKFFSGDVGQLVAHFVSDESLDHDQLQKLRQLLARPKSSKEKRQ